MHILFCQHVAFETPALIAEWAHARGHQITIIRANKNSSLPELPFAILGQSIQPRKLDSPRMCYTHSGNDECVETMENGDSFDMLVIMGGPMGVHDVAEHPWLVAEKALIKSTIDAGKYVLGVCLGAQLIADVLGAKVYQNPVKEIGWMPVAIADSALGQPVLAGLNNAMTVFHWHGDTFELPKGAVHLMASSHCRNQAFIYEHKVLGLQFHLEMTEQGVHALIKHCGHELVESASIHTAERLQAGMKHIPACRTALFKLLDNFTSSP